MLEFYVPELACLCVLTVIAINFVVGRRKNKEVAASVLAAVKPALQKHFAAVGRNGADIVECGNDSFDIWASGHKHARYMLVKVDTKPRQDLWFRFVMAPLLGRGDTLHIELELDTLQESFALLFMKRTKAAGASKMHEALEDVTFSRLAGGNLPEQLAAVGDTEQLSQLLTPRLRTLLETGDLADSMNSAFVGDLIEGFRSLGSKKTLQMELSLPKDEAAMAALVDVCVELASAAVTLQLKDKSRKQVSKSRAEATKKQQAEAQERQEEAKLQRRRQARLEEEARYASLSTAEKRKVDEKKEKQRLKEAQSSICKVKRVK